MPSSELPPEADAERVPDDLAEAGVYPTSAAGFDHGLVVLAMGRPYWLVPADGVFRLLVEPLAIEAAREQLACFDRESIGWPPKPAIPEAPARKTEFFTPLLWALAVLAVFCGQNEWPGGWETAGALDARAVFGHGEWWRLGTALFLHADLGHLASNVLSGIFVFSAVLSTIGRRRGWLLLAVASIAGNFAVAALNYPGPYQSLGASTAIFGGLGLLTGRAIRSVRRARHPPALTQHFKPTGGTPVPRLPAVAGGMGVSPMSEGYGVRADPHPWRAVFVPLAAGLTLLGLFGAGDLRTDVGAHVTGFAAGLVLGFCRGILASKGAPAKP
jgi:membrane associated rhomboid family serine protease